MPSAYNRLRVWFGISALLMICVVAGFYFYARYRVHKAIHDLPGKMGANIQQNTQGFTYSQAVAGHTIFTISASNAVRYKQGGKAELHNVKIVSYGRNSDRRDEITGDDFEYDAQSGDVTAKGKVGIQLQEVESGTSAPSATVKKTGSPVHLQTSGLVFNQKTGIAQTAELITFQLPQGSGSAVGVTYDTKKNTVRLHSEIHLLTSGPKPANLRASSAFYEQEAQELTLVRLQAESGIRRLEAEHVLLHLRDDNTVQRADAGGGVNAHIAGQRSAQLHSATATFIFAENNEATSGQLAGGVTWETHGERASRGQAGEVLLSFAPNNQIKSARLRNKVDSIELNETQNGKTQTDQTSARNAGASSAEASQSPASTNSEREFHGDGLDIQVKDGSHLETATSVGAAEIVLGAAADTKSSGSAGVSKTILTAGSFQAKFAGDNRISTLKGSAPVKIVSSSPGRPDRISQSSELFADFASGKTQTLEHVIQTGSVQIEEGQRMATADRATYNQSSDTMLLSGNVRYKDAASGSSLTSDELALNRGTGETVASGHVKSTYAEEKSRSTGSMLSPTQAVHVTAVQMVARSSNGAASFSGGSRLWQGGNIIQAPVIEFDRKQRTLDAQGQGNGRVSTVFVQADKNGKQVPVEVTADHLHYDDAVRKAVFDGSIVLRSADSTLRAGHAVISLRASQARPTAQKESASGAPSEVQSIDATGNILLQQPGRKAVGNRLIYTSEEQKFVLTGTPAAPPSIFDAEHGQVTGVSLTFFNTDGRVLVDSSNSASISQTRPKK